MIEPVDSLLPGVHLERIVFKNPLKETIDQLHRDNYERHIISFIPEAENTNVSIPSIRKILLAFFAGAQFAFDQTRGKKIMPTIAIGSHILEDEPLIIPVYDRMSRNILLPTPYILDWASGRDSEFVDSYREGNLIGSLPKLAAIGRTGAEEVSHSIWHQQSKPSLRIPIMSQLTRPNGYSETPVEVEGRRIGLLFLREVCDMNIHDK